MSSSSKWVDSRRKVAGVVCVYDLPLQKAATVINDDEEKTTSTSNSVSKWIKPHIRTCGGVLMIHKRYSKQFSPSISLDESTEPYFPR